ncbi:MAG: hypothetical protein R2716_01495 [Microthrixaceae bacterium]
MSERGLAALFVPLVLVLTLAAALFVARLGEAAHRSARLQSSADVTALAAVTGGRGAAQAVAEANGTRLVSTEVRGGTTVVVVADGRLGRSAAAADRSEVDG